MFSLSIQGALNDDDDSDMMMMVTMMIPGYTSLSTSLTAPSSPPWTGDSNNSGTTYLGLIGDLIKSVKSKL